MNMSEFQAAALRTAPEGATELEPAMTAGAGRWSDERLEAVAQWIYQHMPQKVRDGDGTFKVSTRAVAKILQMPQATVSYQVRRLIEAGQFVNVERGRGLPCRLIPGKAFAQPDKETRPQRAAQGITNGGHTRPRGPGKRLVSRVTIPETRMPRGSAGDQWSDCGLTNLHRVSHQGDRNATNEQPTGQASVRPSVTPKPACLGHLREIDQATSRFPGESTAVCRGFFEGLFRELFRELFSETDRAQGVKR